MINQQLLDYIRQQMGVGVAKDAIRQALISSGGWIAGDVDAAMAAAERSPDIGAPVFGSAAAPTKYAGFWIRLVAFMVDTVAIAIPTTAAKALMLIIAAPAAPAIVDSGRTGFAVSPQSLTASVVSSLVAMAIGFLYFILFTYYKGATPGKMLVGIEVRNEDLSRLSFGRVVLRETVGRILSQVTLFIGYIMAAFTKKKRALHDMIAGSVVVYKDPTKRHTGRIILAACIGLIIPGLLISVAIFGILASVVLVSLNSARNTSYDARAVADVSQIRVALESLFNGKYQTGSDCGSGVFASQSIAPLVADIVGHGRTPACAATASAYAISVDLSSSTRMFCVDSTGVTSQKGIDLSNPSMPQCARN